jgi:hypothetical protein
MPRPRYMIAASARRFPADRRVCHPSVESGRRGRAAPLPSGRPVPFVPGGTRAAHLYALAIDRQGPSGPMPKPSMSQVPMAPGAEMGRVEYGFKS